MVADYGTHVKDARDAFRLGESELASRSFRFPDKIAKLVSKAVESLSEFGRLVNGGLFDKADLQFVKFRDDYGQITKVGRGWRVGRSPRRDQTLLPQEETGRSKTSVRSD